MRRFILTAATALLLLACDSTVSYLGGGESSTTSGCAGADCPAPGCPAAAPTAGASCNLPDFTQCRYDDPVLTGCQNVYECQPVYPEAGAPSTWQDIGQDGICECVAPSCDPGDSLVLDCLPDSACYMVDSACTEDIICADDALPQHGCPMPQPKDGDACTSNGSFCDYPLGNGCFSSMVCDDNKWASIGGGCDGSGG